MRQPVWLALLVLPLFACADPMEQELKQGSHSRYFPPVAQTISLNQELNDTLGAPIAFGDVTLKSYDKDHGSAQFDVQLHGPKGAGHALVKVVKSAKDGSVQSRGGDFFPLSGPPIHLQPR